MPIEHPIHPDDYPMLAVQYCNEIESVDSHWETTILVSLSMLGLGILTALGMLEPPMIEQTGQIISNTNIIP